MEIRRVGSPTGSNQNLNQLDRRTPTVLLASASAEKTINISCFLDCNHPSLSVQHAVYNQPRPTVTGPQIISLELRDGFGHTLRRSHEAWVVFSVSFRLDCHLLQADGNNRTGSLYRSPNIQEVCLSATKLGPWGQQYYLSMISQHIIPRRARPSARGRAIKPRANISSRTPNAQYLFTAYTRPAARCLHPVLQCSCHQRLCVQPSLLLLHVPGGHRTALPLLLPTSTHLTPSWAKRYPFILRPPRHPLDPL